MYATALCEVWIKSFDKQCVQDIKAVKKKLERIMDDYQNKVRLVNNIQEIILHSLITSSFIF